MDRIVKWLANKVIFIRTIVRSTKNWRYTPARTRGIISCNKQKKNLKGVFIATIIYIQRSKYIMHAIYYHEYWVSQLQEQAEQSEFNKKKKLRINHTTIEVLNQDCNFNQPIVYKETTYSTMFLNNSVRRSRKNSTSLYISFWCWPFLWFY